MFIIVNNGPLYTQHERHIFLSFVMLSLFLTPSVASFSYVAFLPNGLLNLSQGALKSRYVCYVASANADSRCANIFLFNPNANSFYFSCSLRRFASPFWPDGSSRRRRPRRPPANFLALCPNKRPGPTPKFVRQEH